MGNVAAPDVRISIARAVIYRVLARCFSYPDAELLELFENARAEEISQSWCCLGLSKERITSVTDWLAGCHTREAALMELEKEFIRLFARPYPQTLIQPYGSVYLDNGRLIWGRSTADVARLYEAAGLGMAEGFHDVPDHIAAELEFASYLIAERLKDSEQRSSSAEQLCSIEKRLLTEHLHRWAPTFFNQVSERSRAAFYQAIGGLAQQFVEWDAEHLNAVQHQPRRQADPR